VVDADAAVRGSTGGASSSSSSCTNNRGDGSGGNEVLRKEKDGAEFELKWYRCSLDLLSSPKDVKLKDGTTGPAAPPVPTAA